MKNELHPYVAPAHSREIKSVFKRFIIPGITVGLFHLAGCSTLQPVDQTPESTTPPPASSFWDEIDAANPVDWQAPLNDGASALDWRLRAIDSATDSIDLQTFLWTFDTSGSMVLDHLLSAAERGVKIKMLIDDTFLAGEEAMLEALVEHENIEYRVYNPYKRRASSLVAREILNLGEFHRLDHRMHNKAMIVDDSVAIVGGRNLADEYFGLNSNANFRDMELIVGGPIVQEIAASFDQYWNDHWSIPITLLAHSKASEDQLSKARHVAVRNTHLHTEESQNARKEQWLHLIANGFSGDVTLLVDTPPDKNPANVQSRPVQLAQQLVSLLDNAREEILIVSAYLIPTPHLEGAIKRAAERGVKISILTNSISSNNHLPAHSVYRNHIKQLIHHGAELHEVRVDAKEKHLYMFPPTDKKSLALHAKLLVIDRDKVFIGSANLDPRSLRLNTEMGLLVESQALNQQIRNTLTPDFSQDNAWTLKINEQDKVVWVSNNEILEEQPASSFMQRIEDWFFAHLPIENEM